MTGSLFISLSLSVSLSLCLSLSWNEPREKDRNGRERLRQLPVLTVCCALVPRRLGSGRSSTPRIAVILSGIFWTFPRFLYRSGSLVFLGSLVFPGSVERVYAHVCLRVRSQIDVRAVLAACVPRSAQRRFANRGEILATVPRTPCRSPASLHASLRFLPLSCRPVCRAL